jgi:4-hydroxy-tetrahydrodipicolinate synthase
LNIDFLKGSIVALVTPFRDGEVDIPTLKKLVEFHIEQKTDAIVPCGTTGEAPTLSPDEHKLVVETVIQTSDGRIPIIPGTGSNCTAKSIAMTEHAHGAGANAALIVAPYYNKPTQRGLYEHYRAIAEAVDLPIVVYNIAGRSAVNIETSTLASLAHDTENIVAVKEASGSLDQMSKVIRACGENFTVLSGDDGLTLPLMALGGKGVISVVANLIPRTVRKMTHAALEGNWELAQHLHFKMAPLAQAMFCESIDPELRLPMVRLEKENRRQLKFTMLSYGSAGTTLVAAMNSLKLE